MLQMVIEVLSANEIEMMMHRNLCRSMSGHLSALLFWFSQSAESCRIIYNLRRSLSSRPNHDQ